MKRLTNLPGVSKGGRGPRGFWISGTDGRKGCRDDQGEFVPVSQCNPAQYAGKWIKMPE